MKNYPFPIKREPTIINKEWEHDEVLMCPVCKCESFTNRARLCEHIIICERGAPDVPVILNYSTVKVKLEDIENIDANRFKNPNHPVDVLKSDNQHNIAKDTRAFTGTESLNLMSHPIHSTDLDESSINGFHCESCNRSFATDKELSRHQVSAHRDEPSRKSTANQNASTVSAATADKSIVCPLCIGDKMYNYKSPQRLVVHLRRCHKHNAKTFANTDKRCRFCAAKCATFADLVDHYPSCGELKSCKATSTKPLSGMVAPARAAGKSTAAAKVYKCCMCYSGCAFQEPLYLDHIRSQHNLNKAQRFPRQPRQCIYCGRFLTNFQSLFQHCRDCANK